MTYSKSDKSLRSRWDRPATMVAGLDDFGARTRAELPVAGLCPMDAELPDPGRFESCSGFGTVEVTEAMRTACFNAGPPIPKRAGHPA